VILLLHGHASVSVQLSLTACFLSPAPGTSSSALTAGANAVAATVATSIVPSAFSIHPNAPAYDTNSDLFKSWSSAPQSHHDTLLTTYESQKQELEARIRSKEETLHGMGIDRQQQKEEKLKLMAALHIIKVKMEHKKHEEDLIKQARDSDKLQLRALEQQHQISRDFIYKKYQPFAVSIPQ